MSRIIIIGDSFVTRNDYATGYDPDSYWVEILKNSGFEIDVDGEPSRDAQTILDNWIKILPSITTEDYLVVAIPHFRRTRLPLEKTDWVYKTISGKSLTNRFTGTYSFHPSNSIEFWGKNCVKEDFIKLLEPQEIINSSRASVLNYLEIIDSLKSITKAKPYIFSWDFVEDKSNILEDRTDLEAQIGMWKTLGDEWIESNGTIGHPGDFHWGFEMNRKFSQLIINKLGLKRTTDEQG